MGRSPRLPGHRTSRPSRTGFRAGLVLALWLGIATGGCGGGGSSGPRGRDYLLVPEEVHYGGSYAQWSARHWQWLYELPRTNHPLFDTTGADALQGQVDPVWFIGGILTPNNTPTISTVVRDITIPSGIALFFPIIDVSWSNQECVEPDTTYSFTDMRNLCADTVENVVDLLCQIDGDTILDSPDLPGAFRFRAQAPQFTTLLPADNVMAALCGDPAVPVLYDPVAADGIYVMVKPMPPGQHTIHWEGTFPTFDFHLNVTYHITVLP